MTQSSVRPFDPVSAVVASHLSFAGFSFSGEVREPFPAVIKAMEETKLPVTAVDAPSSWSIEEGPPKSGLGSSFQPTALISLTAPKPLVKFFKGRHFVGGRYVPYRWILCAWTATENDPDSWRRPLLRSMISTCQSTRGWTRSLKLVSMSRDFERQFAERSAVVALPMT